VDELRSVYSTECRFFRDDPRTSTIHWYFVDEGTPNLPFGTAFTSNAWMDSPEGDQEIGEVPGAARTWQNGLPPFPVAGDGHYCGTQEDFQMGGTVPVPPIALNVYGGASCCPLPPEPFVFFGCQGYPNGAWSQYTLIARDATGIWGPGNGSFTLDFTGPIGSLDRCNWLSRVVFASPDAPTFRAQWIAWEHSALLPGSKAEWFTAGAQYPFVYDLAGWNPLRVFVAPLIDGVHADLASPFVVLLPGNTSVSGPFCPGQGSFLPSDLRIRVPAPGLISFGFVPLAQDAPFEIRRACVYQGNWYWRFSSATGILPVALTPLTLTFGAGGLVTLSGSTPLGSPFTYTAVAPSWDLSPLGLVLTGGPALIIGPPPAVTLYTQDDLPP
jgi:hypothetical protein